MYSYNESLQRGRMWKIKTSMINSAVVPQFRLKMHNLVNVYVSKTVGLTVAVWCDVGEFVRNFELEAVIADAVFVKKDVSLTGSSVICLSFSVMGTVVTIFVSFSCGKKFNVYAILSNRRKLS